MTLRNSILLLLVAASFRLHAQSVPSPISFHRFSCVVTASDSVVTLPHRFIEEGSERIMAGPIMLPGIFAYDLRAVAGILIVQYSGIQGLLPDSLRRTALHLEIEYRTLPVSFKESYSRRTLIPRRDSVRQQTLRFAQRASPLMSEDVLGSGLQRSGSLTRGFTVGSNRDFTLNSGLRLQMSGRLAEDIDVIAALTDEHSPIQPEGTTQTLREVDKVFVEIKHPQFQSTLGDFYLDVGAASGGQFARFTRKLQGATGTVRIDGQERSGSSVSVVGASARGTYHTNQFQGLEGVQGPYRLTGRNGERRIVVVAGSERVYVNGSLQTRGEANDYVVDYGSGEVTFSSRRLVTNATRIVVDFEYAERNYSRNVLGAYGGTAVLGDRVRLNVSAFQESDDPDSPMDVDLSEEAKSVLRQSGSDRLRASLPGIRFAGRDSVTGRPAGAYVLKDTTIAGRIVQVLEYAPGDSLAFYNVVFSEVDRVPSDSAGYVRASFGVYRFAGLGVGTHLPLRVIAMPMQHRLVDVRAAADLGEGITLRAEYAASMFDANRMSEGGEMRGAAYELGASFREKNSMLGGIDFGSVSLDLSTRNRQVQFKPLDRAESVEFNRDWSVSMTRSGDEQISDASLSWQPRPWAAVGASYGMLNRTGESQSIRWKADAALKDSQSSSVAYRIERISSEDFGSRIDGDWMRQAGDVMTTIGPWKPSLRIESETRANERQGYDSLQAESFRFVEWAPRLAYTSGSALTLSGELQIRSEDSTIAGSMRRAMNSLTQSYAAQWMPSRVVTSSLMLNLRRVNFTDEFRSRGNVNGDVLLLRSQTRVTPWERAVDADLYYEFSNQRSARMERVFARVPQGSGNYRYLGDLNKNGVADENEFELSRFDGEYLVMYLPGEQLLPVADLKASVRLRLQPARLLSGSSGKMAAIARSISTETYLRLDERSKDPDSKNIYLLNLGSMLNAANTLNGSQQWTQDLFLFENDREFSTRFRYSERYGLVQLIAATERLFLQERSARVRIQLVPEIGNQTDLVLRKDKVDASVVTPRVRDLVSGTITTDFSYRPDRAWETGAVFGGGTAENRLASGLTRATMNEQTIRVVYAIQGKGQVRGEFKREEVLLEGNAGTTQYELTGGKTPGTSWLWQFWSDYRFTSHLQLSITYSGRSEGGRVPIHTARVEARAFF